MNAAVLLGVVNCVTFWPGVEVSVAKTDGTDSFTLYGMRPSTIEQLSVCADRICSILPELDPDIPDAVVLGPISDDIEILLSPRVASVNCKYNGKLFASGLPFSAVNESAAAFCNRMRNIWNASWDAAPSDFNYSGSFGVQSTFATDDYRINFVDIALRQFVRDAHVLEQG